MERALVTGAAGFLGSHVARLLCARGVQVRALDLAHARWERLDGLGVESARGDITDRGTVRDALRDVDTVLHVAALYEIGTRQPARMREINVTGTRHVLEEAAARAVRVVHVSTVAALGPTGEALCAESHWSPTEPRSAYEATKREAHLLARAAVARGERVRIAMPATIFGPGDPSLTGRVHRLAARGWLKVGARGRMRLACVHVSDCADGVVRVAENGKDGEEYVLAADSPTLRAWLTSFASAAHRSPPRVYVPDALLDKVAAIAARVPMHPLVREATAMSNGAHWAFTGDKARRELGWSPRAFDEALRDAASALLTSA